MEQDIRRKRLLYQSIHRGCKETDMLLGDFATAYLHEISLEELDIYEKFINEKDWDIYAWATGSQELPDEYKNTIVCKIFDTNERLQRNQLR